MMTRAAAVVILCAAFLVPLSGPAAGAEPAAPAWSIEAVPYPSAFEAPSAFDSEQVGPAYLVQAYNVGGESTTGNFVLSDILPKGLLPAKGFPPTGLYGPETGGWALTRKLTCSAAGRTVTCDGGAEGGVGPGESVSVVVPVQVEAGAVGALLNKATIEGGDAAEVETTTPTPIGSSTSSRFGFIDGPGLLGSTTYADGSEARGAGSHPYQMTVAAMNLTMDRNTPGQDQLLATGGGLREAAVELPKGTVIDPQAAAHCKESELEIEPTKGKFACPRASQVGTVALALSATAGFGSNSSILPLYNMVPPPGYPAELGFEVVGGSYVHLLGAVRSDGSFTLTAKAKDVLAKVPIGGVHVTLWGEPSAASHDNQRGECLINPAAPSCSVPRIRQAFVTMPSACSGPLTTSARITSWLGDEDSGNYASPAAIEGCGSVAFVPAIEAQPTTRQGDSPTGLEFDLRQSQNMEYENEAGEPQHGTAPLKEITVTLPDGMVLNPSAANGREACTAAQVGLTTAPGQAPIRFREEPAHCPAASKVGTAKVTTPLLDHNLQGSVYLAKPFGNPFDSLLAIYLVVEDEASGIIAKLAGKVEGNAATGQLRTTFGESPQLPLEDVHLSLFDGPRAPLTTPLSCGPKTTSALLTPWSTSTVTAASDSFQVTSAPGGGTCPAGEAQAPNSPGFSAGTTAPVAGAYSPFVLHLFRSDGTQRIVSVDTTLPEGLTGKLAGIPYCPEAQIAAAQARNRPEEGAVEMASPSCPAASEIGTVTVGAGSGPNPIYVTGHAYLAGPYKGAPLSMVIITPAVAGPFDLGVVVVRVALEVDLETARIHAVSDALPTILDGIPLDVRSIAINLDRSGFTLNPTSCAPKSIDGSVTSPAGSTAAVSEPFGVEGCTALAFKPKVKLSLRGATGRTGHPSLRAEVTYPKSGAYANIASAQVGLPHSEFLDQGNIAKACTKPVLAARACPASSIYGKAKAWTPLLAEPLEGPVYLVGGYGYRLPALVAELDGQIRVLVVGKVDTDSRHGIRNTFEAVPDAPVSKFVLQMKGGKKYGLLENSVDICAKADRASARFTAQNGRVAQLHPLLATGCKKAKKPRKGAGR